MKKLVAKIVVFMMVVVAVIPGFTAVSFAVTPEIPDYTGTADTPHPITNKYELASIGNTKFGKELPLDGNYIQTQDIVFTKADFEVGGNFYSSWHPIGTTSKPFTGTYDGGGHIIKNIFVNAYGDAQGIFGVGSDTAILRNAANVDGIIFGHKTSGGLIGTGFNLVEGCYNTGTVSNPYGLTSQTTVASSGIVGGSLAGNNAVIKNCYNTGAIGGGGQGGSGIVYEILEGQMVESCYNKGLIDVSYRTAGITVKNMGTVQNCYNTGTIKGSGPAGIVSENFALIKQSVNTGKIKSDGKSGSASGIAAQNINTGKIKECLNMGQLDAGSNSAGISAWVNTPIEHCINAGDLTDTPYAAGIVGTSESVVKNSYNRGSIYGHAIMAYTYNSKGSIIGCYFDQSVVTQASQNIVKGSLSTERMTGLNSLDNMSDMNAEDKYVANEKGYPELKSLKNNPVHAIREFSKKASESNIPGSAPQEPGEDPDNPGEPEKPGEDGSTANGEIIGTVKPAQIKAVVPTIITFEIDPSKTLDYEGASGDDSFISPSFTMQNAGTVPLDFSIDSITAQNSMPSVVGENKYTSGNWQTLNSGDTNGNIAFGFIMDENEQWATAVNPNNWYGNVRYPFGTLSANASAQLHLKGKYGLNWGNALAKKITYDVVYKVGLVE